MSRLQTIHWNKFTDYFLCYWCIWFELWGVRIIGSWPYGRWPYGAKEFVRIMGSRIIESLLYTYNIVKSGYLELPLIRTIFLVPCVFEITRFHRVLKTKQFTVCSKISINGGKRSSLISITLSNFLSSSSSSSSRSSITASNCAGY